ncbi:hypothetical protein HY772_00495 [Candidatus Woesearchaeota archaeon]|nr:hypothetical protein [Candidatus Woesearchaeota archaeon]
MKTVSCQIIAVIILFITGCASIRTTNIGWPEYSGAIPFAQKEVDSIGEFKWDQRLQIYNRVNGIAFSLMAIKNLSLLKEGKSKVMEGSSTPVIALYDKDSDGKVDTFAHLAVGETSSMDFGFIFDLNHDGKMDYVVFNGGPFPTKDMRMTWMNYHQIDSNYDGKIDIVIYNVDLDGDKLTKASTWGPGLKSQSLKLMTLSFSRVRQVRNDY